MSDRATRRWLWAVVIGLIFVGSSVAAQPDVELKKAVATIQVWYTPADTGVPVFLEQGNGFAVGTGGLIITARHVVDARPDVPGTRRFDVNFGGTGAAFHAQRIACTADLVDICLIRIAPEDIRAAGITQGFALTCRTPAEDDAITYFARPPGALASTITDSGKIIGGMGVEDKFPSNIQITRGDSGGPILYAGRVIGLNKGAYDTNLAYVQALYQARGTIEDTGLDCPRDPPPIDNPVPPHPTDKVGARLAELFEEFGSGTTIKQVIADLGPNQGQGKWYDTISDDLWVYLGYRNWTTDADDGEVNNVAVYLNETAPDPAAIRPVRLSGTWNNAIDQETGIRKRLFIARDTTLGDLRLRDLIPGNMVNCALSENQKDDGTLFIKFNCSADSGFTDVTFTIETSAMVHSSQPYFSRLEEFVQKFDDLSRRQNCTFAGYYDEPTCVYASADDGLPKTSDGTALWTWFLDQFGDVIVTAVQVAEDECFYEPDRPAYCANR